MSKHRDRNHVIDTSGQKLLQNLLPDEWAVRELPKDYGVDFEIEIVDDGIVTGQRIWVQLKSKERVKRVEKTIVLKEGAKSIGDANGKMKVECISLQYEKSDIEYAFACPFPLLLFVADLESQDVYWLPIEAAVRDAFPNIEIDNLPSDPSLRIPLWNSLRTEAGSNWFGLRWQSLELFRAYAFSRIHQYFHGFRGRYRLSHYKIGTGHMEGEEGLALASLTAARGLIQFCLDQDVIFGDRGIDWFIGTPLTDEQGGSYKQRLEMALAEANQCIEMVEGGEYDFWTLGAPLTNLSHTVGQVGSMIYSYEGFGSRFVMSDPAAVANEYASRTGDTKWLSMPMEQKETVFPGNWRSELGL